MTAKKNEVVQKQSSEVMSATDFGGGLVVEGQEDQGLQLSKVVLYQGSAEEEEMYGEHKRGTFLDALESRGLGTEINFVPVYAWVSWAKFIKGQKAPEYSTKIKAEVPAEDLQWGEDGSSPAATESINVVIAVEGEAWPYLFVFKRTGLKAFNKTVKPIEARRAATGRTPGLYQLTSTDDKSADGKPFKRLVCRALGDPEGDVLALAKQVYDAMDHVKAQAENMAVDAEDGEDPPF